MFVAKISSDYNSSSEFLEVLISGLSTIYAE